MAQRETEAIVPYRELTGSERKNHSGRDVQDKNPIITNLKGKTSVTAPSDNQATHGITIEVHNEDTGGQIKLIGKTSDTIQSFIDQLYSQLRITRKDGDRLRCKQVNVFSFANLTIAAFEKDQCSSHSWTFAGQTGGAVCFRRR